MIARTKIARMKKLEAAQGWRSSWIQHRIAFQRGFHSRASSCASAIWAGVIILAR